MITVILYIATSADGFIADEHGNVDWLPSTPDEADTVGFKVLLSRISGIVMGKNSYEQIISFGQWAWPDKTTYVFSEIPLVKVHESIHFVHGDPAAFIQQLNAQHSNATLWLLGGAQLTKSFAQLKLIDECIITIMPTKLGKGIALELFYDDFTLIEEKPCIDGIIQKIYHKQ
jgi:dihydrofolate reductase